MALNDGAVTYAADSETVAVFMVEVVGPMTEEIVLEPLVLAEKDDAIVFTAVEGPSFANRD